MAQHLPQQIIVSNPAVMMGKPNIAGTRITVEHILEEIAAGASVYQLLSAHPRLPIETIHTALNYSASSSRHQIP
jgi:uncharacterized protein (DUF433 family)